MYEPLVSTIIPVYNGSNYLKESIDSALAQTYKNIEVIVVNDGSTDQGETERIALSYGNKIKYYYKENGGVSTALNYGIQKMNGEWFSWLSHDDLYMPNKIKSQMEKIIEKKLDTKKTIISCKTGLINSNGKKIKRIKKNNYGFFTGEDMFKYLFKGENLYGCGLLIPKEALIDVGGFDPDYKFIQDWKCWIFLALKKNNFYIYDEELVKLRIHENQQTKKIAKLLPKEEIDFLNKLLIKFSDDVYKNNFYIKTVLFYTISINDNDIRRNYKKVLKENGLYSFFDKIQYLFYCIKGRAIWVLKKIYRTVINLRYRK